MESSHPSPLRAPGPVRSRLLEVLSERELLPEESITTYRDRLEEPLERILIDQALVSPMLIQSLLEEIAGIPATPIPLQVNEKFLAEIPSHAVIDYQVLPVENEDDEILTLVADQVHSVNSEDDLRLIRRGDPGELSSQPSGPRNDQNVKKSICITSIRLHFGYSN